MMVKRIALVLSLITITTAAHAHSRNHHRHWAHRHHHDRLASGPTSVPQSGGNNVAAARARGLPWCGAYMADVFHFVGAKARELWLAANWAREGRPSSPHVGAVVVWR